MESADEYPHRARWCLKCHLSGSPLVVTNLKSQNYYYWTLPSSTVIRDQCLSRNGGIWIPVTLILHINLSSANIFS